MFDFDDVSDIGLYASNDLSIDLDFDGHRLDSAKALYRNLQTAGFVIDFKLISKFINNNTDSRMFKIVERIIWNRDILSDKLKKNLIKKIIIRDWVFRTWFS